jgi:hypothetical protein
MKKQLLLILLTTLTLFTSCHDLKNIVVTGQVVDETTGQPIVNAEVVVLCWYMSSIDDASFKKQTIATDKNGNYQTTFDKGHQVNVASKGKDYEPNRSYNKLEDNEIEVNLKLSKEKTNLTLVTLLNTDISTLETTDKTPFLRIRIHADQNRNSLDLNNIETFGFDIASLTMKTDTAQCDLWFKIEKREGQPTTILTNKKGGIIPIYNNEINSSFLYEKSIAPTTGYQNEYLFKGNEEGYFVLCRDGKTYGKIILEKSSVDRSRPDGKGSFYKDFGKYFSCLYQPNGSTDLSYSPTDIDLEDFLVDYRLR